MGRQFNGNTANYLNASACWVAGGTPIFSLSAWVRPAPLAASQNVFSLCNVGATSYIVLGIDATGHPFLEVLSTVPGRSTHASTVGTGTWRHLCGVQSGTGSRVVYLDGVAATPDTTAGLTPNPANTTIGQLLIAGGASFGPYNGDAAQTAFWLTALSAGEVAQLAASAPPTTIQAGNLVHYAPLLGVTSPEPDTIGGLNLTIVGTVPGTTDPPPPLTGGGVGTILRRSFTGSGKRLRRGGVRS